MTFRLCCIALPAALLAAAPAAAAERNFGVAGYEQVRVEGPFRVTLTTGVAPFARASGSTAALDAVLIEMRGRTLIVKLKRTGTWGGYPGESSSAVDVAIGTHDLTSVILNGSGSLAIDRAKGLSFELTVFGSGAARIASVAVDQLRVGIAGSGSASLAGTAGKITTTINGVGALDASALEAKDAAITAQGSSTVRLAVTNSAKIDATGTSTIELGGAPACTVRTSGSASVSGCR
ncbi:GIN domain-containing protein [Sphingomonas sp.]|uniref:GIN domain-containing protein n=1 Tax=Sphingomonas sp. TaxID=28214 RepID=UPI00286E3837|nr:DUF2807 domain-containing protein [Sphingomonas sp.]